MYHKCHIYYLIALFIFYFSTDSSEEPEVKKPRREPRVREASTSSRRSAHVLSAECIICQKSGRLDVKKQGMRVKEPLFYCELVNGGRILEQAINEQNTRILRLIQHQDCVALEVKYHATCYLNYTRPLTRKANKQKDDRHYTESFKKFCKDIVEEKLIKEEKAWELVALKKKFVQIVAEVEKVDASSYKTNSLKGRLQSTYPCLRFARPKNPNESDIVYANSFRPRPFLLTAGLLLMDRLVLTPAQTRRKIKDLFYHDEVHQNPL